MPSGYPDHGLLVGVDRNLQLGILVFLDSEGNVVTAGSQETRRDPVYCIQGHRTEFPDHSEIPLTLVRLATKEFLSSGAGQRPTCVERKSA